MLHESHPEPLDAALSRLIEAYRRIAKERMAGLPFYNPQLALEAVGFRSWEQRHVGVVIAPWFLNLLVLPASHEAWQDEPPGSKVELSLPSGRYDFTACSLPDAGPHLSLPLFTSVQEFPDQATARSIATEIVRRLFEQRPRASTAADSAGKRKLSRRAVLGMAADARPAPGAAGDA